MRRLALYLALGSLCLASAAKASSKRTEQARTHRVYAGQTLGMIAKRYNLSIETLCAANGIERRTRIKPDQVLIIPTPAQASSIEAARGSEATTTKDALERKREPKSPPDPYAKTPSKRGFITVSSTSASFRGYALTRKGKVTDEARKAFVRVLASWRTGEQEAIHDRLIQLLVKVSDHFGGRPLRIVSGYRPYSPLQYTPHSRHNLGHAADFMIPGVPNSVLRDYCLTLDDVGVGYYPNSTFVHLDFREIKTYWIDYAGPGEAPRYAGARSNGSGTQTARAQSNYGLQPVGDYPDVRPVDPASFDPGSSGSRLDPTDGHIRDGSSRTRRRSLQIPETL